MKAKRKGWSDVIAFIFEKSKSGYSGHFVETNSNVKWKDINLFDDKRQIIGFATIFDFNHAFEADINMLCLPEQLLGQNISMLEIARQVVRKYNIKLNCVKEIDNYTKFVNERIKLLY